MKLDKRLKCIADMVPQGSKVADIGTDHAYLPVYLMEEGIAKSAVAADIADGPLHAAAGTIQKAGLTDTVKVKKSDGLLALGENDADTVIVAGMGGSTIKQILAEGAYMLNSVTTLILQPMNDAAMLREHLYSTGWDITKETLVEEAGYIYQIIFAQKTDAPLKAPDAFTLEAGSLILRERPELTKRHIENIAGKYRLICANMRKSAEAVKKPEYQKYMDIFEKAEEFLQ